MEYVNPLVSVVIPTYNRPPLVVRAVQSALEQTLDAIEVIVIIDGPDEATLKFLLQIDDSRLRVKMLPSRLGTGEARNAGVKDTRSRWVAFLDDDDEWFPKKLEMQLQIAQQSRHLYPIISCRLIARNESGDLIWPRRFPRSNEILSEYLFCRNSLFVGEGIVQTSTILTMKELLQKVPYRGDLQTHEDWDWLLRASTIEGVGLEFVPGPEPLTIWNIEENRRRISHTTDWRYSLSWVQANRHLITPRAYTSFIMTSVSWTAKRRREWKAFWLLPWEAYQNGKPSIIDVLVHLGIWMIPQKLRQRIAILYDKIHHSRILKHS
jgi:glycosyltransferase involved in cell wall biosynthesis